MNEPGTQPQPRPVLDPAKLVDLRNQRLLSQDELAERAKVSRAQLSKHENGHWNPRPRVLRAYAKALGVKPQELLKAA